MDKYEKLAEEYDKIYTFVTSAYNEDGHELIERISMLNIYLARSGRLLAEANYLYDAKLEATLSRMQVNEYSPSVVKEILKGKTKNESFLCKCLDRLNATITHQLDSIRSQLSYLKTEMTNLQ